MSVEAITATEPRGASEEGGFEEFFRSTYPSLARALLLLTGDGAEAQELAQEALVRAYERWSRVRTMDSPEGYVYRTALNLHRKRLRWAAVRRRRPEDPPGDHRPTDAVDDRDQVLRMLGTLPRGQREALILVEWVGMTAQEAGVVLGIEPVSVRGRLHRARASLRRRFGGLDG